MVPDRTSRITIGFLNFSLGDLRRHRRNPITLKLRVGLGTDDDSVRLCETLDVAGLDAKLLLVKLLYLLRLFFQSFGVLIGLDTKTGTK